MEKTKIDLCINDEKIKQIKNLIKLEGVNDKFKTHCPYHDDISDSGSLIMLPAKDLFHCFGCGQDGNLSTLLEKIIDTKTI